MNDIISTKEILSQIFYIRGKKVMIDVHLALLYQVETRVLNQAVQRNISRFPDDFMFRLSEAEYDILKSQFVTSSWGGRRKLPYVFTEQGIAMLSGILRSEKAIAVNIAIMRAFVQMRELIDENKDLKMKLDELEIKYDKQFKIVFDALKKLIYPESTPRKAIGYKK